MKSALNVPDAPKAVGPYSQAQVLRLHGGSRLVFTAGQVGLDPRTGKIIAGGVAEQTAQAMKNLSAVLAGAGLTFADVVKTTVYLTDMKDFNAMNEVYGRHFPTGPPARSTVAVVGLPLGALVEIDTVAAGRDH